ncbi:putative amino acid-binding ACT domain protein [Halarchaeum rubridurum]|uniref:Putative amino acid-binding ACT domain protein n=1 Tax=Halarchaeum rubridurum TaxID=489911 RepID=A0A830G004_9EURY|nr:DUF3194 domain-containing protein [Halarchaeum rubridurum]MBP1955148.1 putative amino acid-binding ACT domain protein [Halarchaeum rubridurum]GGM68560.1 hypothetical protein GCM10009017_18470 [Halarchaeum rubridurum]
MVDDETVVQTAAEAAEGYLFSRVKQSDVRDLDVAVTFEDGVLTMDVYVNAPAADVDEDELADEAARVGREAVDDLFAAEE